MKKRLLLVIVFGVLIAAGSLAQNHWISLEASFTGGGVRYEYLLSSVFTLGAYFYYNYNPVRSIENLGFGAAMRLYPFVRRFFLELGIGFNHQGYTIRREYGNYAYWYDDWTTVAGFALVPGFGWTIDIGRAGAFFLAPQMKIPVTFGHEYALWRGLEGFILSFGVGFAF